MQLIELSESIPGIRELFMYRPETEAPLNALVQTLLHSPHPTLSAGERELIAAYVSRLNTCRYCCRVHGNAWQQQLWNNAGLVKRVLADPANAPISSKMKALLKIADKVKSGCKNLPGAMVTDARMEGATETEIYDSVLIADAFCMYNCYVAGLAAWQPDDAELYD
jgi:uncharacterized peroxidase-related enzyme